MLASLWDLVETWWLYALISSGSMLLGLAAGSWAEHLWRHLDARQPDSLPRTTAEWVEEKARVLGLQDRISVLAAPDGAPGNHFNVQEQRVVLTSKTFYKNDPLHWAIGAHELGHAWFYASWPRLARITTLARGGWSFYVTLVPILLLANATYGSPGLHTAAMRLLWVSIALSLVVLLDELAASSYALKWLRTDERLSREQLRSARTCLWSAAGTYLASTLGLGILFASWDWLSRRSLDRADFVPVSPLSQGELLFCAGLTSLLVYGLLVLIQREKKVRLVLRLPAFVSSRRVAGCCTVSMALFLFHTWDQPMGEAWPLFVGIALNSVRGLLKWALVPIALPLGLLLMGIYKVVELVMRPSQALLVQAEAEDESSRHTTALRARKLRKRNRFKDLQRYERLNALRDENSPRALAVWRLSFALPMLAYFWMQA